MNEAGFMGYWPKWEERMNRLIEAQNLIRKLWQSDNYFNFNGKYFKMTNVRLHPKPKTQIPIYFSAIGEKSAYMAGKHTDKLMTAGTVERCEGTIFPRFDEGARSVGRDPKHAEKAVTMDGGLGSSDEIIRRIRKYSAGSSIPAMFNERDPRKIERAASTLSDKQILDGSYIFDKPDKLIEVFDKYLKIGATQVIWDDFTADPDVMLNEFRSKIIPYFKV